MGDSSAQTLFMENQWQIEKKGAWGSNSKPFTILVWKLSPGWFIADPKVALGRDQVSSWSPLADHQIEQLDPFPVLHEISHRIFHFKSNGMFSQIKQDSFNVYGCFVGILFGSRRDLKIKYISFWWPGAKLEGDEAPGVGQQELVRLVARCRSHWPVLPSTCSPVQCPSRHLNPAGPPPITRPAGAPWKMGDTTQMFCKIKKVGSLLPAGVVFIIFVYCLSPSSLHVSPCRTRACQSYSQVLPRT